MSRVTTGVRLDLNMFKFSNENDKKRIDMLTKKKKGSKETTAGTSAKLRVKQISPFNFEKWCKENEEILKKANFYEKKCESTNDWVAYFDGFPGVAVVKGLWVSGMHAFGWTFR